MFKCSVEKYLTIEKGTLSDYQKLARFHYRDNLTSPFAAIWVLRNDNVWLDTVGVIVYTMPVINCSARNKFLLEMLQNQQVASTISDVISRSEATRNPIDSSLCSERLRLISHCVRNDTKANDSDEKSINNELKTNNFNFTSLSPAQRLRFINKNIRCISRVIIDPRFRGLGLAAKLVRETMDKMDVPIIEALAVLGHINPFFEKAGMTRIDCDQPPLSVKLKNALSGIGIDNFQSADAQQVQNAIDAAPDTERESIEKMLHKFVGPYGQRRFLSGIDRLEFVLGRLAYRPIYYVRQKSLHSP